MRTLIALASLAVLSGCAIIVAPGDGDTRVHTAWSSDAKEGDGVAARDQREVKALAALDVSGSLPVEVRVGPAPSLVVEADSNLLSLIRTETQGDTLRIYSEKSLRSKTPLRIVYTTPRLSEVRASGATRVEVSDLNGAPLDVRRSGSSEVRLAGKVGNLNARSSGSGLLDASRLQLEGIDATLSGSSRMRLGQVKGDHARLELSGSSSLDASGAVRSLSARVSGSANVDLADLKTDDADLGASGAGGIRATVKQSLFARTSGSGGIRVYGHPAQRSITGDRVHLLD
ncbi:head GIN domain-containing protein [Massilia sp. CFBP9026]|uniref:head GIN domain-containing protein n=1 Tax=Massilia sp. CFBP9026 TaxID=3096536 RepID=UPI002A69B6DA|nr:head GIN domain-containing protein [Massilia sp. CFBP9026]MDY0961846.1 head GIN domain-containing protein [Massilia sp. CFBP9026]